MFEKILVPLDGSKLAEQALLPVVLLAKAFGSEVIVISVCESDETKGGQACSIYIHSETEKLKEAVSSSGAKVNAEILLGKPDTKILSYAEIGKVDLVAMSSHGRSGIMPWSLGGTVTKVLHKVGVPLIVVRAKEKETDVKSAAKKDEDKVSLRERERERRIILRNC